MQGLVIELPNALLFGPPPKTKDDLRYLVQQRGIQCIVNLCPFTNERTKNGTEKAERYMDYCHIDEDNPEKSLDVTMIRHCLELETFEPKGRNKNLKKESTGQFYATHIRSIQKEIEKVQGNVYIHNKTGANEEAYIAFGLFKLNNPKGVLPYNEGTTTSILEWIRLRDYEWLFDEGDNDKKELLGFVLAEIAKENTGISMLFKKIKKDE